MKIEIDIRDYLATQERERELWRLTRRLRSGRLRRKDLERLLEALRVLSGRKRGT